MPVPVPVSKRMGPRASPPPDSLDHTLPHTPTRLFTAPSANAAPTPRLPVDRSDAIAVHVDNRMAGHAAHRRLMSCCAANTVPVSSRTRTRLATSLSLSPDGLMQGREQLCQRLHACTMAMSTGIHTLLAFELGRYPGKKPGLSASSVCALWEGASILPDSHRLAFGRLAQWVHSLAIVGI